MPQPASWCRPANSTMESTARTDLTPACCRLRVVAGMGARKYGAAVSSTGPGAGCAAKRGSRATTEPESPAVRPPAAVPWSTTGAPMSFAAIDGRCIEYAAIPGDADSETLVFLHEGLGSVALWRDFPR